MAPSLHVAFGTGGVALAALDALHRRGQHARKVDRSGGEKRAGVYPVAVDRPASDQEP